MHLLLLVLSLAHAAPLPPDDATPPSSPSAVPALLHAANVGLYQVVRVQEECSGMGGAHLTLMLVETGWGDPPATVYTGGHAFRYAAPDGSTGIDLLYVLSVQRSPPPPPPLGWCITPSGAEGIVTLESSIGLSAQGWLTPLTLHDGQDLIAELRALRAASPSPDTTPETHGSEAKP